MPESRIIALIESAASRSAAETAALASALSRHCWPRGGDRTDAVAIEWVRRWSPQSMHAAAADCACASTGRCGVCN